MGFLIQGTRLACALAALLVGCASAVPPLVPDAEETGFRCRPIRGTAQGLVLELTVPEGVPQTARVAIFRDGEELGVLAVADLGDLPQTVVLGDPSTEPGQEHGYLCGIYDGTDQIDRATMRVTGGRSPERPPAPSVQPRQARGVGLEWHVGEDVWITVLRRDVLSLESDERALVSPMLLQQSWLDEGVEAGGVYAYSLRATRFVGEVPWHSEAGPEQYVEVPER